MAEQEWKITNSFWTPDTPAASFFADREVFEPYYYEGTFAWNTCLMDQHSHCITKSIRMRTFTALPNAR